MNLADAMITDVIDGYDAPTPEAFADRLALALENGFAIVPGGPHYLCVDIDSAEGHKQFYAQLELLQAFVGIRIVDTWPSASGKPDHQHFLLYSDEALKVHERLLLQAVLGSDPKRELLGWVLHRNGVIEPSVLFRPRPEGPKEPQ